jgi:CDP-4-dehydro-6-deoxyglucose reductase
MLSPWRKGVVTKIINETYDTRRFWIQVPDTDDFDFKPGQFITFDLPIHEQKNKRVRSYSIASAPDGSNVFELLIKKFEPGLGSGYLFNEVKEKDELSFRGPLGMFTLPETLDKDLYLICTGTGIAPFRSMLQFIQEKKISFTKIYLIYGCRKFADTLYEKEMREREKELEHFHYLPVYSREPSSNGSLTGYVHDVYDNLVKNKPDANFYLCGWRNMIDEARERLKNLGYDKKNIHFELYG